MTQETLTSLFGWMAVLNIAFLFIGTLAILVLKNWAANLHSRLFGIEAAAVPQLMYEWLGHYKIATLVLSVVPYFALRLV